MNSHSTFTILSPLPSWRCRRELGRGGGRGKTRRRGRACARDHCMIPGHPNKEPAVVNAIDSGCGSQSSCILPALRPECRGCTLISLSVSPQPRRSTCTYSLPLPSSSSSKQLQSSRSTTASTRLPFLVYFLVSLSLLVHLSTPSMASPIRRAGRLRK